MRRSGRCGPTSRLGRPFGPGRHPPVNGTGIIGDASFGSVTRTATRVPAQITAVRDLHLIGVATTSGSGQITYLYMLYPGHLHSAYVDTLNRLMRGVHHRPVSVGDDTEGGYRTRRERY